MAVTKAKVAVYRAIFDMAIDACNKGMQYILAGFALYWFGKSFDKYILSNTPFDAQKWGAANVTFLTMIVVVYAYFFKSEKEKKEGSKMDKIVDALITKFTGNGNNPPTSGSQP